MNIVDIIKDKYTPIYIIKSRLQDKAKEKGIADLCDITDDCMVKDKSVLCTSCVFNSPQSVDAFNRVKAIPKWTADDLAKEIQLFCILEGISELSDNE